jgi:hypothetical protein
MGTEERDRVAAMNAGDPWRRWGPYLSERAWGTVREDYSEGGTAWEYFPHDHARSRVFRWSEDGLAGLCDDQQDLCLALVLWNGRDPILKERAFGLTGNEGNHGEDVKEQWWYLDATPTHSWARWRYHYPQSEFPYSQLVDENRRRGRLDPEYELLDTGVFDAGYWTVVVEHAKASPSDVLIRIEVTNAGPQEATLDVLPTLWFRNTWAWGLDDRKPSIRFEDGALVTEHQRLGRITLHASPGSEALFCENETNDVRLFGAAPITPYPKDGINDHVVHGASTVNPDLQGTKAALRYRVTLAPGGRAEIRLRLGGNDLGSGFDDVVKTRAVEADDFYASLTPEGASADEAAVMRQAFAGMLWSKQFFHYDVERWLEGDSTQPRPPEARKHGRNSGWRHLNNHDVISMPDPWEYPWYAAWDLAFHCIPLAHLDPEFAKNQLILLCREWYMHPNGQLPAYEWAFDDVNPPVHAWAALRVFEIDGGRDYHFLERLFHKLLLNFTWWVNRKDTEGNNVFEGGFLGLDNIGPFDRSADLPVEGRLEQSDGTAWMAMYCLSLLEMSVVLADHDPTYEDVATKFFEHFTYIASAMQTAGLWDENDGFFYDVIRMLDGSHQALRARSMVGIVPMFAVTVIEPQVMAELPDFATRMRWFLQFKPEFVTSCTHVRDTGDGERRALSILSPDQLRRILRVALDETEFLSPYGLRSLSRFHLDHPLVVDLGGVECRMDYEPGESTSGLFGGNSNWRGPVWFPLNYLAVEALRRFHRFVGDEFTVEHPVGSGRTLTLAEVADDLSTRLISLFLNDGSGRRPVFGDIDRLQTDAAWHDCIPFHEYFHGDTGAGLGASHQTGWTGLVAHLITSRRQH